MTSPPPSVVFVSPSDRGGGAEMVAWNLFCACRRRDIRSHLVVGSRKSTDPCVIELANDRFRGLWARIWAAAASRFQTPRLRHLGEPVRWLRYRLGHEDMDFPASRRLLDLVPERADLVHAHNLHGLNGGFFDLRSLQGLSRQVPTLLTLHDAWLIAGHCAHSFDCERWLSGCGSCPDISIPEAISRDASDFNWRRKYRVFVNSSLFIATPCQWLMERVSRSILAPAIQSSRVIPHGVDLDVFRPGDQRSVRHRLGIDDDSQIVMCLGNTIRSNTWRDLGAAVKAVKEAAVNRRERVVLVLVGEADEPAEKTGLETIQVPHLSDPTEVAAYLQAADVFLHPARADTFPSAVLEAMACGVPVIATAVGGIPEQVSDGSTGFLVKPGEMAMLSQRLGLLLGDAPLRHRYGCEAADVAVKRFDFERVVSDYLDFYSEITNGEPNHP